MKARLIIGFLLISAYVQAQIPDAEYYLIKNRKSGLYMAMVGDSTTKGGKIVQMDNDGHDNLVWSITDMDKGFYKIENKHNYNDLGVYRGSQKVGASLVHWDDQRGRSEFLWDIVPFRGYFKIKNVKSNRVMGVYQGRTIAGVSIVQSDDRSQKAVQWELIPVND